MKIFMKTIFLILFLSCQQDTYELNRQEFYVKYPKHLILDESGKEGTIFTLTDKKESENDFFIENINLISIDVKDISFANLVQQVKNEVKSYGELIENKEIKINDVNCLRLISKTKQNDNDFTTIQHIYHKGKIAYVLTFSSESKSYDKYYEEMNNVMMSFEVK